MNLPKKHAGEKACEYVEDGMVVGLGTGSTVFYTLKKLGEMDLDIIGICTSEDTEEKCEKFGIETSTINEHVPEVAIDGADEVDAKKDIIKGGGGALTREKIIDYRSDELIIVVGENKIVNYLGERLYLPIEVLPFAWKRVKQELEESFEKVEKRDFVTDNDNYILDCYGHVSEAERMERKLNSVPGIVENGLFTQKDPKVLVGNEEGVREV